MLKKSQTAKQLLALEEDFVTFQIGENEKLIHPDGRDYQRPDGRDDHEQQQQRQDCDVLGFSAAAATSVPNAHGLDRVVVNSDGVGDLEDIICPLK